MRYKALCLNYDTCNYAGKCDRNPDNHKMIFEEQPWACFRGTEVCPAEEAREAEIERLRVERDALILDCTVSDICSVCKHNSKNENDCRDRKHFVKAVGQADCFEWRGVKEGGEA